MSKQKIRSYDKEFKKSAINLYLNSDRSYDDMGKELGIPGSTLANWVSAHDKSGADAFPGKGHIKPSEMEVANLRKELAIAREERDILKKALGIFSSQRK